MMHALMVDFPLFSMILDYGPMRLQHTKCYVHIFIGCLLFCGKVLSLLILLFMDGLHKATPVRVDTISQKVIPIVDKPMKLIPSVLPLIRSLTIGDLFTFKLLLDLDTPSMHTISMMID